MERPELMQVKQPPPILRMTPIKGVKYGVKESSECEGAIVHDGHRGREWLGVLCA